MPPNIRRIACLLSLGLSVGLCASAQRFLSEYDSTLFLRDTVTRTVKRFENLHISGYMQPQFQVAGSTGIQTYEGPNFSEYAANRFTLRRTRVKVDYILPSDGKSLPKALFSFQLEATERDVNVRDMFLRLYEPKYQNLALTAGLFARPFGYEVNLASAYRESPERGRMSQILLPSERDVGVMVGYEAQQPKHPLHQFKLDVGVFNGQGKSGPAEFDNYKDIISRLTVKPIAITRKVALSGGLSVLYGGWRQDSRYRYETKTLNGNKLFVADSSLSNIGAKAPRHYYGADAQLIFKNRRGKTELRAEYWRGTQPGTANSTTNPGVQPTGPTYLRQFDGAFFYLLQNIINEKWELVVKWDWYDPNTNIAAGELGKAGTNFTAADVRYNTVGFGLTRYFSTNLKVIAYHAFVRNEATALAGYTNDSADDVFTLRMQLRF